jgi:hypothetical protein
MYLMVARHLAALRSVEASFSRARFSGAFRLRQTFLRRGFDFAFLTQFTLFALVTLVHVWLQAFTREGARHGLSKASRATHTKKTEKKIALVWYRKKRGKT